MIVYAQQLLHAAEDMRSRGLSTGRFEKDHVSFTPDQIEAAGRILADGPQPIANGIKADMPGFIEVEQQESADVLVFMPLPAGGLAHTRVVE